MTEKERKKVINNMIKIARLQQRIAIVNDGISNWTVYGFQDNHFHTSNGREIWPESRIKNMAFTHDYTRSEVRLNIDGKEAVFFWLIKLK